MKNAILTLAILALCTACSGTRPAPDISFDEAVEAQLLPDLAKPLEIVEIPKPMPLPGQLKLPPGFNERAPVAERAGNPQDQVKQANQAARIQPSKSGYVNAIQVWPYTEGALYQLYTSPERVTDIVLEPGEKLIDIGAPDTVRWVIGDTRSGQGATERVHVSIKPTRADLRSNLALYTDRRTYYLEVTATPASWMSSASWDYPQARLASLKTANAERASQQPIAEGLSLNQLKFRYAITGDTPSWRPLRAFDDGIKVYIQFPDGIGQGEMPPLFIVGASGETELVNYRVRAPYYIVDRLFGAAELRLGGKKAQSVRITRTDGKPRTRARPARR